MRSIASNISHFSSRELSILFKKARRVLTHPGLHILIAPAKNSSGRILVVTPRKIGNAPIRNKIRRRIKSIFYENRLFEMDFDCIVIIKPSGTLLSFENLRDLLTTTLKRYCYEETN